MANIAPGLGGTFKTSTAEGRALEVLMFVSLAEQQESTNPENQRNIQGSVNTSERVFEGTYRLPASQTISPTGELTISAVSYLTGLPVNPGTDNPTFKSLRSEAYLLEVLMYLQFLERNPAKNTNRLNVITGTYNSDTEQYAGTFRLPIQVGLAPDGSISVTAIPYLQT